MPGMSTGRTLLFASAMAAAMIVVGFVAASAAGRGGPASNILVAASPTPTFQSNETATHEASEPAARETAENNGTFRPAGGGGPGHSNETSTHEAGESEAQEAAENAKATATPSPTTGA